MSAPLLVADSGPLIALARLQLLALPSRLFTEVLVTATVWHEVTRAPRGPELSALSAARGAGQLRVVDDPAETPPELDDDRLDAGEKSALTLALLRHATVLVDERHGRAVAIAAGLAVVGTLGMLALGRKLALIGPVRPLAASLVAGGYHLAPSLVEQVLADLGE